MSFQDDSDSQRRRRTQTEVITSGARGGKPDQRKRKSGDGVGDALRSAYQRTLHEEIPPEMLDLLGKLD